MLGGYTVTGIELLSIPLVLGFIPLAGVTTSTSLVTTALNAAIGVVKTITKTLFGFLGSGERDKADAEGARLTNEISSAMDLNRFAFRSGTISVAQFDDNWKRLWGALQNAANEVSSVDPEYARRMIADRDYGGKFANIWQGVFHDDPLRETQGQLDDSGYVKPEFQWEWPDKASYMEIPPIQGFEQVLAEQQQAGAAAQVQTAGFFGTGGSALLIGAALLGGWLLFRGGGE
jgi:hypothetical protein